MLAEWVMLGGVVFWILVFAISVIALIAVDGEDAGWGALFILSLIFVPWLFVGDLYTIVTKNPWWLLAIPGYFLGGATWAFIKWVWFIQSTKKTYARLLAEFKSQRDVPQNEPLPEEHWRRWSDKISSQFYGTGMSFDSIKGTLHLPTANANQVKIKTWCVLWPWSFLWTFIEKPWDLLVAFLSDGFQMVADKLWKGFDGV